jgi:hypothetical protein
MTRSRRRRSTWLSAGELYYVGPFLRFFSNQLGKLSRCCRHRLATKIGEAASYIRIRQHRIERLIERVDDLGRRALGRADAIPDGAEPRYGTCNMFTPAIILNNSPDIWIEVPMPDDAKLILPGLAFA